MVDRYYRKIENVENEIENSIQISGILLKLKEHDDLSNNDKNDIINNQNDITNNQNDIINNQNDIINNQNDIINNQNDIINNQKYINNNQKDITNNKNDIINNQNDIQIIKNDINNNKNDIQIIKNDSHYKLKNIYTFDIKSKNQFVDKNNPFHIFEQNIINDFKKDSFLEVSIKVLTEISSYILIGFFEILCEFYNENNDLFYDISLSTAMGSINKLSTVKSVFLVPINKNMTKIKIDFYIRPKLSQQSRSATYNIIDINSNKIYIKYFQK